MDNLKFQLISNEMKTHYSQKFREYGATAKGVDWGKEEEVHMRYKNMLAVVLETDSQPYEILDVGCGYGGLYQYANNIGIKLNYTGIDLCEEMIEYGKSVFPGKSGEKANFICQDIMSFGDNIDKKFNYVLCNGILTQKLTTSIRDMDLFARHLIRKMFDLCLKGIAFNVMTNKVNFMAENLYYKSPLEMLNFCIDEISTKVRLNHAYPIYEYTVYLYK